jgi:hypothetical protein
VRHPNGEKNDHQRDKLESHTPLHKLLAGLGIGAARHVEDADQQHSQNGKHREHNEEQKNARHFGSNVQSELARDAILTVLQSARRLLVAL